MGPLRQGAHKERPYVVSIPVAATLVVAPFADALASSLFRPTYTCRLNDPEGGSRSALREAASSRCPF
jgi:hypothetical protein